MQASKIVKTITSSAVLAGAIFGVSAAPASAAEQQSAPHQVHVDVYNEARNVWASCPRGELINGYTIKTSVQGMTTWDPHVYMDKGISTLEVSVANFTPYHGTLTIDYGCTTGLVTVKKYVGVPGAPLGSHVPLPGKSSDTLVCPADHPFIHAAAAGSLPNGVTSDSRLDTTGSPQSSEFNYFNYNSDTKVIEPFILCGVGAGPDGQPM